MPPIVERLTLAEERRLERYHSLRQTVTSDGWQQVIAPALLERANAIANKLARGKRLPETEIRELQAQFILLEQLVSSPLDFFADAAEPGL